jgi:hypothetical protein
MRLVGRVTPGVPAKPDHSGAHGYEAPGLYATQNECTCVIMICEMVSMSLAAAVQIAADAVRKFQISLQKYRDDILALARYVFSVPLFMLPARPLRSVVSAFAVGA